MNKIQESVHYDFEKLKENKQFFDEFYENNYKLVYRICLSILKNEDNSEDVAQNVFEKIYKLDNEKLPKEFEASWLYKVVKNEALQFIRKTRYSLPIDENIEEISNDNEINNIEDRQSYDKMVKKLNKKQEQVINLKVLADFTFREIGEILAMPTATVQWYYYRSITSLKVAVSNFAMFIIAFVIGLKVKFNVDDNNKETENYQSNCEQATTDKELESKTENPTYIENVENIEKNKKLEENDITNIISGEVSSCEDTQYSEISETSFVKSITSYKGIIGISFIFLTISIIFIIFFKKNQQKLKLKHLKSESK